MSLWTADNKALEDVEGPPSAQKKHVVYNMRIAMVSVYTVV